MTLLGYPAWEVLSGLVLGIVAHECAHALAAVAEGDDTPLELGRVSLMPWVHMDLIGSVLIPAATIWLTGAICGWCRPVPVMRSMMRAGRDSWLRVQVAGPAANFLVAGVCGTCGLHGAAAANLMMGCFNLLPVGKLDGGKILKTLREG